MVAQRNQMKVAEDAVYTNNATQEYCKEGVFCMNLAYSNLTEEELEMIKELVREAIASGGYSWKIKAYKEILEKLNS